MDDPRKLANARPGYTAADAPRRRAVQATFSPYLTEVQLIEALWLLQSSYTRADMATLIGFVNAVTERFGLIGQRSALYAEYYANLKLPVDALPPDPWPLMVGEPPAAATAEAAPAPEASPSAAAPAATAPSPARAPAPAAETDSANDTSPRVKVFAHIVARVMDAVDHRFTGDKAYLLETFAASLEGTDLSWKAVEYARAWATRPTLGLWQQDLEPAELSTLTHQLYVALCDAVGPVGADEILTEAVESAARQPESRDFSPRQLL